MADVVVRDNQRTHHWEAVVDDQVVGFAQYEVDGDPETGTVAFVHTEVDPGHEGEGIGHAIVQTSLDAMRQQGRRVRPQCPFYARFVQEHPEYADLVAED